MTGCVEDVQADGAVRPNPQSSCPSPPLPGGHVHILDGPAGLPHAFQDHDLALVRLGEIDPLPVRTPRGREGQPAAGEQHRRAGLVHTVHTQIPSLLRGPVQRESRSVGTQGRPGHGHDAAGHEHSGFAAAPRAQFHTVTAPLGEYHKRVVPRQRLRLHLDPGLVRHRFFLTRRQIHGPDVQRSRLAGGVIERAAIRRINRVEVDAGRVDRAQFIPRIRADDNDPRVVVVVTHERDPVARRMPGRTRIHVAPGRQPPRRPRLQIHHPDPSPRRKRELLPVRRGCRIDRSVREDGQFVPLQVDVMPVPVDMRVPVLPLTSPGLGDQRRSDEKERACRSGA